MQPHVNDMSQFPLFTKMAYTGLLGTIPTAIGSLFDRIKVRCYARQNYQTQSFMHFKETNLIFKEVLQQESYMGLAYGLKGCLDYGMTQLLSRFVIYDFIIGRSKSDHENQIIRQYRFSDILIATLASSTSAAILTQPSEALKIKVQLEPLNTEQKYESYREKTQNLLRHHQGSQSVLMMPGLLEKIIFKNCFFLSEIFLFFEMRKQFKINENSQNTSFKYSLLAGSSSVLATLINQPLEILYHRQAIRYIVKAEQWSFIKYLQTMLKNEGWTGFYKGVLPNCISNGVSSFALMFFMQKFLNYEGNQLKRRQFERVTSQEGYKRGNI